jgi:hypothetical protein
VFFADVQLCTDSLLARSLDFSGNARFCNSYAVVAVSREEGRTMVMPRYSNFRIWFSAFVLLMVTTGCSDPDKNSAVGKPGSPLTPPTVVSVNPSVGVSGICQGSAVTATFSKAMNPATITSPATAFTLAAGANPVAGIVSVDATNMVATFTPMNPLALDTQYTATITTGAQDQFGNGLAQDFVWMFTTAIAACPSPIAFGAPGCSAGILAGQAITSTGLSTVTGDLDISPLSSITGFPPGTFTGTEHIDDSTAATAQSELTTAYTTASTLPPGTSLTPDIGGQTLPPGVYTTINQPSLGITGNLTLDPVGDPNATWIFQISSTLTTASGIVTVVPPGKPGNVFWAIGSAATLGTTTTMAGNLMAQAGITMDTGATLNGRALAQTAGAVTIDASTINVPPCGP